MRSLAIVLALLALAPAVAATPGDDAWGVGEATILMGAGCPADGPCHPAEYAWVLAEACVAADAQPPVLEAQRVPADAAPVVIPMDVRATGSAACPYRAVALAQFWSDLVDPPVECLRASVTAHSILRARAACFSDL